MNLPTIHRNKRKFVKAVLWRYACLVVISSGLYCIYTHLPYYQSQEFSIAHGLWSRMYAGYLVLGLPFYSMALAGRSGTLHLLGSKTLVYLAMVRQLMVRLSLSAKPRWRLTNRRVKVALLSLGVKGFYLPLMTMFACGHTTRLSQLLVMARTSPSLLGLFFGNNGYAVLSELLFFIDTTIFLVGYSIESRRLRSQIKSVEPTFFGWFVALICYPPFNGIFLMAHPRPLSTPWISSPLLLGCLAVATLLCQAMFVWASIALGFKASNLTNRGIVTWGPYRWVRHPAYIVKLLGWWCELLPRLTLASASSLLTLHAVYFLRAWTEEHHLLKDADYQRYVQQVRFRFIPGVI